MLSILFMAVCFGLISGKISEKNGRTFGGGFAWGFFLGIIGLVIVMMRD
jgi:hypothetical protein